ncbi:MAG: alginate lyase family protein [Blastocatellia bacterium]
MAREWDLSKLREKLEGMTAREIGGEALLRARKKFARAVQPAPSSPEQAFISDAELYRSLAGRTLAESAARVRGRRESRLTPGLADLEATAETFKNLFPDSVEQTCREADAILAHRITVFDQSHDLGSNIDWHRDALSGAQWPLEHFTRVTLRPGHGADVRVLWELNRLHQLTTLGRAYALTTDERYAEEFVNQLASWYEDNPPGFGANWTVAMEAAIRAVNVIAAMEMFRFSPRVTDDVVELILKLLVAHGRFIRSNLEFSHRSPSNHYLSGLIGLFVIGTTVPELSEARRWRDYGASRLAKEMSRQVLEDGVDYEGAIGYHRFVTELFALWFSLSEAGGPGYGVDDRARLVAMFDFARHYLKPDGTSPAIGDSDDGRLLRFKERPALDHAYLMPLAAVLLDDNTFKQSSRIDEEAIWWFGRAGLETFERLSINESAVSSRAFPRAQIFVQRAGELYSIIDCGDHGLRGRGSHAHSDALSLEVFACGRTFLRDPGTYVYSASESRRNLFRSTAYHNTVRVDGKEISQINRGEMFALGPNVRPRVNRWESNADRDIIDAEHHAYARLADPVTHRRVVTFDKRDRFWILEDSFTGRGMHRFEFFFNFDAGLEAGFGTDNIVVAHDQLSALALVPISGHALEARITTRWISPAYGTRTRASGIIFRLNAEAPFKNITLLIPYRPGEEQRMETLRSQLSAIVR